VEKFWWPSLGDFDDVSVEETEEGFTFSAPDDTEAGAWLQYWSSTEERLLVFETELKTVLINHANKH
jgi:hypothetical protein